LYSNLKKDKKKKPLFQDIKFESTNLSENKVVVFMYSRRSVLIPAS